MPTTPTSSEIKVTINDIGDLVLLDRGTSANSLVKMIRQRINQPQDGRRPVSNNSLDQSKSNLSVEDAKPTNMTLTIVSLDTMEREESIAECEENIDDPKEAVKKNVEEEEEEYQNHGFKMSSCLEDRPLWRLFLVMTLNGLFSLACSALIIAIEKPAQDDRLAKRQDLLTKIDNLKHNIKQEIVDPNANPENTIQMIKTLSEAVAKTKEHPDELVWDMLNAQAFITSVQTTTGYGDIVPSTTEGKVFTLAYAVVAIPVFMWYIVKLGGLFRVFTTFISRGLASCFCPRLCGIDQEENATETNNEDRRRSTFETIIYVANSRIKEQFEYDKRFHPSVIGLILLTFLLSVAYFISYMEGYNYFNALYACFITYSTIGFGDIDIFRVSYRSSWLNLLIYGNFIHILGYMILSAWIASLLEKAGVRKF